jgi:hypothetical protein
MNISQETMIGLVPNLGNEYYALTATPENLNAPVSKSLLWQFNKSPYKWRSGIGVKQTENMIFGSLVHALCFTPTKVDEQFTLSKYDDFRTKEAREWKAEMQSKGIEVVKELDWHRAEDIKDAVMESEYVFSLGACDYEVAAFGKIGETLIKGMLDILPHSGNTIVDLKVTSSIGDEGDMKRLITSFGYHWQAALYLDLYNGLSGKEPRTHFEFLFIEDSYPHEMAVIRLSDEFIQKGREGYMNAVAKWQNAVFSKKFSPKHQGVVELDPPAWA